MFAKKKKWDFSTRSHQSLLISKLTAFAITCFIISCFLCYIEVLVNPVRKSKAKHYLIINEFICFRFNILGSVRIFITV